MVDATKTFKIGAADRNLKLLNAETCQQLAEEGFDAVELYIAGTSAGVASNESDHRRNLEVVAQSSLSLAIHIVGDDARPPFNSLRRALNWLKDADTAILPEQTPLIFHPAQGPSSERGAKRPRLVSERATKLLAGLMASFSQRFAPCLENLPHDPKFPDRFGDNLGEIVEVAEEFGLRICFDLGHYLTGEGKAGFVPFEQAGQRLLKRLGHVHVHGVSAAGDHQPLRAQDNTLRELVRQIAFDAAQPYRGIFSLELNETPALFSSRQILADWLKET